VCNTLGLTNEQKIKAMQAMKRTQKCMCVCMCVWEREREKREREGEERVKQGILRGCTLLNTPAHVNS
jgi:hypothetical protein